MNSSQGAQQALEERVSSVLKAADSPSSGSFTALAKVSTDLQLTVQPSGKTLTEAAALSLLTIAFVVILIIILNLIMLASLKTCKRKNQAKSCVMLLLGHRP